jgi:hypothetical protein
LFSYTFHSSCSSLFPLSLSSSILSLFLQQYIRVFPFLSHCNTPFPYNTFTPTIASILSRIDIACDVHELRVFLPLISRRKTSHGVWRVGGKT